MANERLNAFLKKLDEREAATRGGTSPGASAASKKEKVNNKRAAEFLKRIGIDEEYYSPVDETDIEPFRSDVQELRKSVNNAQLPSQVQKNQQRYNQLEETGGYLEAFANPQDVGTRKDVFQGNYTLKNLKGKMDLQRAAMGAYENDMAYVQDNTQSYADYQRYLRAAMGDEYAGLRGEMYTYGMDKTDAAPGMTLEDINSEINALVKEITDAQKPKEPMRDPMSGMVMPTAPVDVSAQEARLKELYGMLENKQYISDEEAEEAQKSYFDRFKEDRQAELDAAFEEADRKRLEGFKLQQQAIESEDPAEEARLREEAARMDEAAQSMMDETQLQEDAQQAEYDALKPDRNWGQYIGSGVMQGFSDFANAAYQTYDVVLGKPIDAIVNGAKNVIESVFNVDTGEAFRNPLSKWADTYKKVNDQYQTQATEAAESMGGSEAWKVGQQVIGGLVQNVPNTVLAFLTGGASVGAAGMQKAATKAMNAVGNSKVVQAAADMISNPQYWLSFSQTVGNDYNQALEESGDPMKAALYAMLTSVVNAGIEIGASGTSGIQGINQADDGTNIINRAVKAVTGRDAGAFGRIIDSASDEALEELQQGIVSGLAEKVIYDANKQYFSMSDENAIVSPELAKQALVGGITGGLLGGGAEVTNAAVGAYQNAEAQREYARAVEQYFNGGSAVTGETQMEGVNPQTAEMPTRIEKPRINDERAVTLTGEDTAYEYGLTGRRQEELQNTLEESGIEMTDADRVSFTKGETQRKQNTLARVEYIRSLNRGEGGSRKGVLRSISAEEAKQYGVQEFKGVFSDKQRAAVDALRKVAEMMHINIVHFESPVVDGVRKGANGMYDSASNTVYVDLFAGQGNDQAVMRAAAHELTHVIQEWSPEKYTKLQDMLIKYYYSTGKNTLNEMIQAQKTKAAENGMELTESQALDEVTADACEMMFSDIDAMREIARTDKTLFEKIGEWINKFVDSIKTAMQGIRSSTKESSLLMESKETWENARKIWYQALEEAGQNNPGSVTETAKTVNQTAEIAENVQKPVVKKADSVVKIENKPVQIADGAAEVIKGAAVKNSLRTWTEDERTAVTENLKKQGFKEKDVKEWIHDVDGIAAQVAKDKDRLDFTAADNQVMLKNNQEYVKTLDASTLCAKRLVYQGTFNAVQHALPDRVMTSDDLIDLRNLMAKKGYETPCGICYVESRRRHLGKFADEWVQSYQGEYKPHLDDVTTTDGLERLRKEHPEAYNSFMAAMKKKGSNNPKVVELRTEYRGDIRKLTNAQIKKIREIGGLRVQSFSDFETPHLLDMMQAVLDMAAKGLTSQAYTKVPNFAAVFGDTGIKINLSLIAEGSGLDKDGNLLFSSYEGMDFDRAMELREQYSENVGTILVGLNDAHIKAAMADDRIDFIIPFHKSGWGQEQMARLSAIRDYEDYTDTQNERKIIGYRKNGNPIYKNVESNFYPVDYWDFSVSGTENAENYLRMCAEDGRIPKFNQFLVDNGDGSYSLPEDGSADGYWKMLIDYKMYDNDGVGAPQRAVQPVFNMEEADRVLREYEGGADTLPVAKDVVSEFVDQLKKNDAGVQYSLREADAPTQEDVEKLRSIGKKSINAFTDAEVQQTEAWARKFWGELKEKSPFFRRWFGDWRAYDRTEIPIVKMDDSAEIKSGKETNADSGIVMSWSKDLVNDSVRHAPKTKKDAVRIASNNIREIVRESVLLDTQVSETGKSSKLPGTAFMHSLYTLVSMDDKKVLMKLYAEQALNQKTGEIFTRAYNVHYIEKVAEFENGVHSISGGLTLSHSTTDISVAELYEIVKQYDENFKPATVNRSLLNEDGTPKAAYHGTPSYGFTVFDKNLMGKGIDQFGAGFYFATDKNAAESYGDKQYEVYLNIKKPIRIERSLDGGDLFEVEITPQQAYQILKRRPDIMDSEESPLGDYIEEYWSEGPKDWMIREMAKNFSTIGDLDSDRSAFREYPNELHEAIRDVMGYDGVEVSFDNTKEKFYVAWFPEQIKSATDNIGTFDASNPDIRYSQRDTEYKTDRQLLASALEGVTKNAEEAQMLREYQEIAAKLDADERRVQEINERIRELRLEDVNTPEEKQLLEERKGLEKGITTADRRLFQMERLQPLQRIAKIQRREAEEALQKARRHLERYKEGVIQREYIGKIKRTSDRLAKWLTKPNNQRYVPEDLRRPLAEFLLAIDRGSETMLTGGGMTQKDRDYARVVDDLRRVIESINKYQMGDETADVDINMHFDLPHGFSEMMADMVEMLQAKREALGENLTLNRMNSEELENLYKVLVAINTSIIRANEFLSTANTKHVDEVAEKSIAYLNDQKERRVKLPGADFITWTNTQPIYAFERFGEGGKQIFKMLQNGQSKLAYNTKKILEAAKKIYTSKQVRKWLKEKKTFTINGKEITIPVTHIMSLYCISKRAQGQTHLYGDGIRLADVKKGPVTIQGAQMRTTEADVQRIIGSLTQEQRQVADAMQKLMSTLGAQWGNEVSMKRFGFRMFTEQHYFPLRTVSESRTAKADGETGNELYRLLNISSTKPIIKGAKNMILLDNIFDVFATHMSDMAQYNALALPVLDAVKWLNYKEVEEVTGEEGETKKLFKDSVRNAARIAYGDVANKYIMRLLKDVNGAQMTGGEDSIGLKMIGRQNRAAVAGNMRVVMLQPLSIIRAGLVLGDMSVIKGLALGPVHIKKNFREMEEYSGIAVWKELGFYDVNISRGVKQMIKNDSGVMDKTIEKLMAPAGIADHVTWALMWEATKRKVKKTMNPSQEGYMEKVAETFEEVVYKTQVVDSVLTKSQYMRGKSFWSKMSSSFMSEPTTTYNMVMDAHYKLLQDMKSSQKKGIGKFQEAWMKNKNGKRLLHTISIFTMSALVSTMIEQLFSAYRDEDDYETFMEKYVDGALDTFINNMVLVNKLPVLKDVWETGKTIAAAAGVDTYGYENETVIGSITSNLEKAVEIYADLKEGNPTNYTKWGMTYKGLQAISDGSGVPFSGVAREVTALYNNVIAPMTGRKIVVYQTGKSYGYQQLYEAIQSGNTERESVILAELHENGADDKEIESGLRKLAKEDWTVGNLTDKEAIAFLKKYNDMTEKEAYWKLEEWGWEGEDEDDKFSVYSELEDALLSGKGIDAAITKLTTHGYEKEDVQSRVRAIIKDGYLEGDLSKSKVESLLKKYGAVKTDNDVWFKLQQYEYERLTKENTTSDVCMVFYAIDQKQSPKSAIDAAMKHGKTKSGLASSLTSRYKEQYLELLKTNKSAAYQLATRLAGIFDYLGYDGTKKVQGWTETK